MSIILGPAKGSGTEDKSFAEKNIKKTGSQASCQNTGYSV